jgi:dipeptidyl aminopeptidase/acylaminoacyl peptidase
MNSMRLRVHLLLGLLAGSLSSPARAAQPDPAGTWIGQWERDGSLLDVDVVFTRTDSGYLGRFSSRQLRVVGIPFQQVRYEGSELFWTLVGDATTTTFEGSVQGDALVGRFREGEASGTFRLTRGTASAVPLEEEEITFASGPVTLSGTVIYPVGQRPFPAVVFLHGSGAEGRWASRYLANEFARRGVAALIYDKRGVGRSTGEWQKAGFEELVADASAAVEALRARPRVAPGRVGIHGHSQGGTIAPWVASENPHVSFVVASAAPGLSMAETEIYSVSNVVRAGDMPAAERQLAERYVRAIVATAFAGAPRADLEAVWREARDRPWAFAPPPESDFYWSFSRRIASYDPAAYWRRVSVPSLLVYGQADERVPPRRSAARIAEAYLGSQGSQLQVVLFPDADHTFRLAPSARGGFEWPRTAPGYPDSVISWVLQVTGP